MTENMTKEEFIARLRALKQNQQAAQANLQYAQEVQTQIPDDRAANKAVFTAQRELNNINASINNFAKYARKRDQQDRQNQQQRAALPTPQNNASVPAQRGRLFRARQNTALAAKAARTGLANRFRSTSQWIRNNRAKPLVPVKTSANFLARRTSGGARNLRQAWNNFRNRRKALPSGSTAITPLPAATTPAVPATQTAQLPATQTPAQPPAPVTTPTPALPTPVNANAPLPAPTPTTASKPTPITKPQTEGMVSPLLEKLKIKGLTSGFGQPREELTGTSIPSIANNSGIIDEQNQVMENLQKHSNNTNVITRPILIETLQAQPAPQPTEVQASIEEGLDVHVTPRALNAIEAGTNVTDINYTLTKGPTPHVMDETMYTSPGGPIIQRSNFKAPTAFRLTAEQRAAKLQNVTGKTPTLTTGSGIQNNYLPPMKAIRSAGQRGASTLRNIAGKSPIIKG